MSVGERIHNLRKKRGYTQEDLANKLNMSRQAVAKWEKDLCEPSLECLIVMAKLFEVSLDFLITGNISEYAKESVEKSKTERLLDRVDIVLLIALISSIVIFIGLFIYALLNPLYRNQTYSFLWWYIPWAISSGIWFRILVLISTVGLVVSLVVFLRRQNIAKKH